MLRSIRFTSSLEELKTPVGAIGSRISWTESTFTVTVSGSAVPPTPLVWQPGGTRVIPGRGYVMEQADVVEYRDMLTIIRDVVQDMIKKGMTLEQIRRAEPTKGYTKRYGSDTGPWTTAMFVDAVYASLTKGAAR